MLASWFLYTFLFLSQKSTVFKPYSSVRFCDITVTKKVLCSNCTQLWDSVIWLCYKKKCCAQTALNCKILWFDSVIKKSAVLKLHSTVRFCDLILLQKSTVVNCILIFCTTNGFGCFHGVTAKTELIKHKILNYPMLLSKQTSEAMHMSEHQLPQYYLPQWVASMVWTPLVMWYTNHKPTYENVTKLFIYSSK